MINKNVLNELRQTFKQNRVIKFNNLIPRNIMDLIKKECHEALDNHGHFKDFTMNYSTRKLSVVSGQDITALKYPTLYNFAISEEVADAFRFITDNTKLKYGIQPNLFPCHINYQNSPTFHHGWHLDDAGYKLVITTLWQPGSNEKGGQVGLITNFVPDHMLLKPVKQRLLVPNSDLEIQKEASQNTEDVCNYNVNKKHIQVIDYQEDDCYFMEGRRSMHCVYPLTNNTRRVTACFSFDDVHDGSNYQESADLLYQEGDLKI